MAKKKVGRPTKYSEQILKATHSYLMNCHTEGIIPYKEELALELDIDDDTIVEWAKLHKPFSAAIKKLEQYQRICLYRATMERNSATGAIFQLKVNHGKIETSRNELTGKDGKDLPVPILANVDALRNNNSSKKTLLSEEKD